MNYQYRKTVTIASGQSLSNAAEIGPFCVIGIEMPAAWTAADLTFQQANDAGGPWRDVKVGGATSSELVIGSAANDFLTLDPATTVALNSIKVRSGTSAAPVNQAASRDITLIVRTV